MRQSWTDDRLDEFGRRIDERFDRVDERFDSVDKQFKQIDKQFEQVGQRFDRVEADVRELRHEVGALHRALYQVGGGLFVAILGLALTQL